MWRSTIIAAVTVCALALPADAQHRGKGHGWHGGHYGRPYHNPLGGFVGGLFGGWVAGQLARPNPPTVIIEQDDREIELEPWSKEWYAYCSRKFRSFDPETGTFLSYTGDRRFCK